MRAVEQPPREIAGRVRSIDAPKSTSLRDPLIVVIRHGSTSNDNEAGENKVIRGQDVDEGLSSKGKSEMATAGSKAVRYGIKELYTSPMKRSRESGSIVGDRIGVKPQVIDGLKPWKVGSSIAGKKISEIKPIVARYQTDVKAVPPGGESYATYFDYTTDAWNELMKKAESADGPIAAIAHSRDILALPNILMNKGPKGVPVKGAPANGSISELRKVGGKWKFTQAPADTAGATGGVS